MAYRLIYPESYIRRARKFIRRHPGLQEQYPKALELLALDPAHPSLRLHRLKGKLSDLHSVSINIRYRITIAFVIEGDAILLVDVGKHEPVY